MSNIIPIDQIYASAQDISPVLPEPVPLPLGLPAVPAFDPSMLPTELGPWLEDICERLNVPMDFVAVPAMIAAGSLVGARIGIRPQTKTSWTEPGNLWGCIVGSPGVMKSPAVTEVLAPLRRLDVNADNAYQNELAYFEDQAAVRKLAKEDAEKRARKAVQAGEMSSAESILAAVREVAPPSAKRFLVTDATVEKLGEICAANPDGLLVYRDELMTLLSDLEAEDKAAAKGFFMTGWTGKDFYSFDRITRGTIRIPRVNLSLVGTTQPSRLAGYIRSSLEGKNDGMVQRLQLLCWPDASPSWEDCDRHPCSAAMQSAFGCFERLARLDAQAVGARRDPFDDGQGIPFLRFEPQAVERFVEYRHRLETAVRGDDLPPALVAHLSKYRGLIPRLALIIHLTSGGHGSVPDSAVAAALKWADYLEAHAKRAYGSLTVDAGETARLLWRRLDRGDLPTSFTERDIYRRHWSNLQKGPKLTEALKLLVEYDWLAAQSQSGQGRPTIVYTVNPRAARQPIAFAA